jgi:hypothetical protein
MSRFGRIRGGARAKILTVPGFSPPEKSCFLEVLNVVEIPRLCQSCEVLVVETYLPSESVTIPALAAAEVPGFSIPLLSPCL